MTFPTIAALLGEAVTFVGLVFSAFVWIGKISNGQKCQLRSEMLRTYYHNREAKKIRQYEYENFVYLYEAYKALKGNSFIDKIYDEVKSWEVIS